MKTYSTPPSPAKKLFFSLGALAFWLAIWQGAYLLVGKDYLLASPAQCFARLLSYVTEAAFWRSVIATCVRVLVGFVSALMLGTLLAFLASRFFAARILFSPLLRVIRATPVASFIILALVWVSTNQLPVLIAFVMVLPLSYSNLTEGIAALDRQLLEMSRLFRFSRARTIRLIYLPALMPYIAAASTAGLGFAWKSVVAAEVIAHPALSIGRQLHNAKTYFEIADLFAWTATVVLISVLLEHGAVALLRSLERRLMTLSEGGSLL